MSKKLLIFFGEYSFIGNVSSIPAARTTPESLQSIFDFNTDSILSTSVKSNKIGVQLL